MPSYRPAPSQVALRPRPPVDVFNACVAVAVTVAVRRARAPSRQGVVAHVHGPVPSEGLHVLESSRTPAKTPTAGPPPELCTRPPYRATSRLDVGRTRSPELWTRLTLPGGHDQTSGGRVHPSTGRVHPTGSDSRSDVGRTRSTRSSGRVRPTGRTRSDVGRTGSAGALDASHPYRGGHDQTSGGRVHPSTGRVHSYREDAIRRREDASSLRALDGFIPTGRTRSDVGRTRLHPSTGRVCPTGRPRSERREDAFT